MASTQKTRFSTKDELDQAKARGIDAQKASCAREVTYSAARDAFALRMFSGARIEIPRELIPVVAKASKAAAAAVRLSPSGSSLHWERLDMDHSVPGLVRDVLGITETLRRAGSVKSPAKAAASKKNGQRGGRPPKKRALAA